MPIWHELITADADEIPGNRFALVAEDNGGARFGLVGPRNR